METQRIQNNQNNLGKGEQSWKVQTTQLEKLNYGNQDSVVLV